MARYKTAKARKRAIERLAEEVCSEALNYRPPNSPATMFFLILSASAPVEPAIEPSEIGVPEAGALGWRELELLKDWLGRMWRICETPEDIQYLHDLIYGCEEW